MKLTLGKAAKAAGISKPSLSAAIKKGRLSASKNEAGHYEIDPAELFRVYPKQVETDSKADTTLVSGTNGKQTVSLNSAGQGREMVDLVLAEQGKLLAEKERTIERLEEEKQAIRSDLEDQKEQNKRVTLLLEHQSTSNSKESDLDRAYKALEARLENQERAAKMKSEKEEKVERENRLLRKALKREREKGWFEKMFQSRKQATIRHSGKFSRSPRNAE